MFPSAPLRRLARRLPFTGALRRLLAEAKRNVHMRRRHRYNTLAQAPGGRSRVLVLMNGGIGNAVEATPLLEALRALWPKAHITAYVPAGDLFDNWCVIDEVTCFPESFAGRAFEHTFMTWSVDPPPPKCDPPPNFGVIHDFPLLGARFLKPEREYNLDMARGLGYHGPAPPLYVSMHQPREPIPPAPLRIALVPAAKPGKLWRYKCWPYYGELSRDLLDSFSDAQICILGGSEDAKGIDFPSNPRILDFRGRHSLQETAWLLRHSHLAVGNDSGPMHIADAVGIPALTLFGPTCELKNGPQNKAVPMTVDVACRPCQYEFGMLTCSDPRCLNELTAGAVMARVRELLSLASPS